jgi:uncharacterized protein with gpF-like domain
VSAAQEQRILTRVLDLLRDWLRRVADAVLRPFRTYGMTPDPGGVYETSTWWNGQVDILVTNDLEQVAREGWEQVADQFDLHLPFVSTDSYIQAQLAFTQNLLVRIPDEIYNLIFAEISDGVNDGDDPRQLAARIDRVLDFTGSENWRNRAMTIAVTEANRANNAGALAAGFQAQQIEAVPLRKRWLATEDSRTRPDHKEADGQLVPLGQPFIVGNFPLMFPGDPAGPPHQVIFCRCAMLVED